jgi:hypothetical protein
MAVGAGFDQRQPGLLQRQVPLRRQPGHGLHLPRQIGRLEPDGGMFQLRLARLRTARRRHEPVDRRRMHRNEGLRRRHTLVGRDR